MPIPDSNLPGHRALHERTIAALELCQEAVNVEFKSSAPWNDLQNKVVKSVLSMGNLRDGGMLIVGVHENGNLWELTGITEDHFRSYNIDDIQAYVGRFVSPAFDLEALRVEHQERQFLTLYAHEFAESPLVCKRNGPAGTNNEGLVEGGVYVRLAAPPRTTRVMDAAQMHSLLELAAEKRARRMIEVARRIGGIPPAGEVGVDMLDAELEGL